MNCFIWWYFVICADVYIMTYVHVLYISLCSTTKNWLVPCTTNTHNPLQLPITQPVEGDVTSEDLNNLVMKITTELFFSGLFCGTFSWFSPRDIARICLFIYFSEMSEFGQDDWAVDVNRNLHTNLLVSWGRAILESCGWKLLQGRIQPHLLRKYCMGYND